MPEVENSAAGGRKTCLNARRAGGKRRILEENFLSFLYPDQASAVSAAEGKLPNISESVSEEIGLSALLPLKKAPLSSFFTASPDVIAYRQAVFSDLSAIPDLSETLRRILPMLSDMIELRALDHDRNTSGESYLYSITEVELYIRCVDTLREGLAPLRPQMKSAAFSRFTDTVTELSESKYYKDLNRDLSALASRIQEVKSITVGVNLDSAMRPVEAGVISVNQTPFRSGKLLDKILRMSFRNDAMTCIASLVPFGKDENENRQDALSRAFFGALEEVFRSSVRAWREIVGEYVLEKTDFLLRILPEIEFITRASDLIARLSAKGCALTLPAIAPEAEKCLTATGLYNPDVALRIEEEIVPNDFAFDDDGRFYILTGPNRGGKSVITCAVGLCQALFQLGLPVPAKSARISPADGIYTHFPTGAEDTIDKGRLGEECARLREIFSETTENSLILLDESLSSTGSYEASFLAAEILAAFGARRVRGIFSTHLHELAAEVPAVNERSLSAGGIRFDTLVAGIEEGKRSFLITRRVPDGKSYARDIAEKYGLTFDTLLAEKPGR